MGIAVPVKDRNGDMLRDGGGNIVMEVVNIPINRIKQDLTMDKWIVIYKMKEEEYKTFTNDKKLLLDLLLGKIDPLIIQQMDV